MLASQPGRIFSRDQLRDAMYRDERIVADRTVDSHIKKLRRKMPTWCRERSSSTRYSVGYHFEDRR